MSQRSQLNHNGIGRTRGAIGVTAQPNLFRNQLTRRPTASSNPSAETARLDVEVLDTSEIVVRNQLGEIQIDDPPTPVLEDTDGQAEDREEIERERQRLVEAVKNHRIDRAIVPHQPEELLEAIRASLRVKVTALANDNWMFEPDNKHS